MKGSIFIFCLVVFNGWSQTLSRQLYEHYFKGLYKYEPAMVRENNISSLEVFASEMLGDEVIYQGKKEWVDFRKDGRPIQQITWDVYHRDSIITDFSYDSLGNLVEFRQWIPKRSNMDPLRELEHAFFQYEVGYLIKVFSYSMKNGDNYSTLNYCDSLNYSADKQKVSILHGNANGTKVIFQKTPSLFILLMPNTEQN
jgi:hypothetical protein